MVSLRNIVAVVALIVPVIAQTTPAQVVQNLKSITQKSQDLQGPAQSVNIINGPLVVVGLGPLPQIITGLHEIVTTTRTAITQMKGMAPVQAGVDSDNIFDAFSEFVREHQLLLNILIDKAGLFQGVPSIGAPVAAVLREIKIIVDTTGMSLINSVQSRATDLQNQASSLGGTITAAINAYDGLISKRDTRISRIKRAMVATV